MDLQVRIYSLKENPHLIDKAKDFVIKAWADEKSKQFYTEVLQCNVEAKGFIPHFLFALTKGEIVGCVGVALQNFVSCANLYPFLVALYVEKSYRKKGIARMLVAKKQNLKISIFAVICVDSTRSLALCFTLWRMMFLGFITAFTA
ncbi:GNAT family N-acetyltransferase [uncultured Helicobacter sp.]|uniref:GNAT family N-acetyltransferase n=1 Tax=uncultured Helicobacter sp. TaxID=175537 RepID=UPI0025F4E1A2|nr:GNAT family N-acetyltransferase [uncultured Helicobacter sp.]